MTVLKVNSSAVAEISFNSELEEVGIAYNSNPEKFYIFSCKEVDNIQKQIETAESVGKLIAQLKNNQVLVPIQM